MNSGRDTVISFVYYFSLWYAFNEAWTRAKSLFYPQLTLFKFRNESLRTLRTFLFHWYIHLALRLSTVGLNRIFEDRQCIT